MKKLLVLLAASLLIFALCVPAFAGEAQEAEEADPVLGSWKLDIVLNNTEGEEPVILKKDEAASLYGAGISILTFDVDGYAHEMVFEGGAGVDLPASWEKTDSGEYIFTVEDSVSLVFVYDEAKDVLVRNFLSEDEENPYRDIDFVYTRAFVGSWTIDKVLVINEGDAPEELSQEENAAIYGSGRNIFTFRSDGTAEDYIEDGPDTVREEAEWKLKEGDLFVYTERDTELEFNYFRLDDVVTRDFIDDNPNAPYAHLRFIYVRTETPEGTEIMPTAGE